MAFLSFSLSNSIDLFVQDGAERQLMSIPEKLMDHFPTTSGLRHLKRTCALERDC